MSKSRWPKSYSDHTRGMNAMKGHVKMKSYVTYKNWVICSSSYRQERQGRWTPQYTATREGTKHRENDVAIHHAQLKTSFWSENEADESALQDAMRWIDTTESSSTPR